MSSKDLAPDADAKKKRPAEQQVDAGNTAKVQKPAASPPHEIKTVGQRAALREARTVANISVEQAADTKFLCLITNDVSADYKRMQESGSNPNMIPLHLAILRCLKPIGYHAAPYENAKDVPPKLRKFSDENGKPTVKPVLLAAPERAEVVEGGPVMDLVKFRTFEKHPNKGLQTKTRGLPTEVVGALFEGISMNMTLFDDRCAITSPFGSGSDGLPQNSVAKVGMKVRNKEQCEKGYGLSISSVEVLGSVDAGMHGLYPQASLYSHYSPIAAQAEAILKTRKWSGMLGSDLDFVKFSLSRADKPEVMSVKPVVMFEHCGEVTIAANNAQLHLKINDERSIYNGKVFDVALPQQAFSDRTRKSGLSWLQGFYNWCMAARACDLVVVHDDYRFKQADSARGMTCFVVPSYTRIFSGLSTARFVPNEAQLASLFDCIGAKLDLDEVREDGSRRFWAWVAHAAKGGGELLVVIVDTAAVKTAKQNPNSEPADTAHSSLFCQIYAGMSPQRGVYISYLVRIQENTVKSALMAGIQAIDCQQPEAEDGASLVQIPVNVNIDDVFC